GWVHRDISSGNLYWFEGNNGEVRGILADLEYAKCFRPEGSLTVGQGTAFFMAVEIQKEIHLYIPQRSLEGLWLDLLAGNTSKSNSHFVVHNFEHDMESISFGHF
ncbi:hypothetical protein SCLCIDRAFT_136583, partial [Scleroderma citrinum Foug A]